MENNFRDFAINTIDELGLSDYEVAKLTGIKSSSISRWRTGKTTPRKNSLRHLAQLAGRQIKISKTDSGLSVDWVAEGQDTLVPYIPLQNIRQTVKVYTWTQAGSKDFFRRNGSISQKPVHALKGIPDIEDPLAYSIIIDEERNALIDPYTRYGDVMIMSPAASVKNGDHVVARLVDGRVISRKIQFSDDNLFFTRHAGGAADFSVKAQAVSFYHKVVYIRKR
ncbi:helix-turn-helix transcriptional regulator [bacterium]|nr:helix-turn-helix transcriptional regulator [bacterium]